LPIRGTATYNSILTDMMALVAVTPFAVRPSSGALLVVGWACCCWMGCLLAREQGSGCLSQLPEAQLPDCSHKVIKGVPVAWNFVKHGSRACQCEPTILTMHLQAAGSIMRRAPCMRTTLSHALEVPAALPRTSQHGMEQPLARAVPGAATPSKRYTHTPVQGAAPVKQRSCCSSWFVSVDFPCKQQRVVSATNRGEQPGGSRNPDVMHPSSRVHRATSRVVAQGYHASTCTPRACGVLSVGRACSHPDAARPRAHGKQHAARWTGPQH
jgi:hypothetical protein